MSYVGSSLKVYLMSHMVTQKFVTDFLDRRPEVLNWHTIGLSTVLIVSRSDLAALSGVIHVSYPWLLFTLAEIDASRINGFINPEIWTFIAQPKSSGRWE